jgi:hypothetical protein
MMTFSGFRWVIDNNRQIGSVGIILEYQQMNTVMKIGRNEEEHLVLQKERENHEIYSYLIEKGKNENKIPLWLKVPEIKGKQSKSLFTMEKLNGPSLSQLDLLFNPYLAEIKNLMFTMLCEITKIDLSHATYK